MTLKRKFLLSHSLWIARLFNAGRSLHFYLQLIVIQHLLVAPTHWSRKCFAVLCLQSLNFWHCTWLHHYAHIIPSPPPSPNQFSNALFSHIFPKIIGVTHVLIWNSLIVKFHQLTVLYLQYLFSFSHLCTYCRWLLHNYLSIHTCSTKYFVLHNYLQLMRTIKNIF